MLVFSYQKKSNIRRKHCGRAGRDEGECVTILDSYKTFRGFKRSKYTKFLCLRVNLR